jgi:hypothetical protein
MSDELVRWSDDLRLENVPIVRLYIDPGVNTKEDRDRRYVLGLMQQGWRWDLYDPIHVVPTDRGLAVIDGGTRLQGLRFWEAAGGLPDGRAVVKVHYDLRERPGFDWRAAGARLFIELNTWRRAAKAVARLKAEVTARSEAAVAIDSALSERGLFLSTSSRQSSPGAVSCQGALKAAWGLGQLDATLDVLLAAWGPGDQKGFGEAMVTGVAALLHNYPDIKRDRLVARLAASKSKDLVEAAAVRRRAVGGGLWASLYDQIVDLYGRGSSVFKLESKAVPQLPRVDGVYLSQIVGRDRG